MADSTIFLIPIYFVDQREGLSRGRLSIHWTDALIEHLAKVGFDARYGARPLQRTLEREVVAPLARFLLENPALNETEVVVDWNEGVVFR